MQDADELIELAADLGEAGVRRVLLSAGASAALRAFDRACAIALAIDLRRRRVERKQIIERLIVAYGFSRRKAYMVDDEAIDRFCKSRVGFAKDQGTIEHLPTKAEDAHDE
jgi:hypothetical protein